ncbi:MAG: GNAT family N-acetyltransferase [Putridiphycobacter sp.]
MTDHITFRLLTQDDIHDISILGQQLNPKLTLEAVKAYQTEMFKLPTYYCFGILKEGKIIGISSGWLTIRYYSGKQLEVDNVIIDKNVQSKGYGKLFFEYIEEWAKQNDCKTVELNTYLQNSRSHKFYYNLGYSVLGFHFWKQL